MGGCHFRRPELALRNPRVTKGCFDPRLHDRRHGPYVDPYLRATIYSLTS